MDWSEDSDIRILPAVVQLSLKATARDPRNAQAWERLGQAQLMAGNSTEAIASLSEALQLLPDNSELQLLLARAYERAGKFESALDTVERLLAFSPDDPKARIRRFELLVAAEKLELAREASREVARLDPANSALVFCAAEQGWEEGEWAELLRTCETTLTAFPAHTNARYHRALALAKLGRPEAPVSMDLDTFVSVDNLPVPPSFVDSGVFHAALRDEILRNPTLSGDPRGKATRSGLQTERLEQPGASAVNALLAQIRAAVDEYAGRLPVVGDPFATLRPKKVRLVSWAVIYTDQGKQVPHIHPDGWLSGTYYVAAPEMPEGAREGSLLLGAIKGKNGDPPPWGIRTIAAIPGRTVLFPSWVPHATEPTHSAEQRICVAFDVVPMD